MAILDGLLYALPYKKITDLKHSKIYDAQAKEPTDRTIFGYTAIKLEEDVIYHVGWRDDAMKKYHAKKGDYLVQTPIQPPIIIKTWAELRKKYHVFQNTEKSK